MILDATCSSKRLWPAVADVRVDISRAAHPDVLADCRHLPFADATFDAVYCDPPHLVGGRGTKWAADKASGGHMTADFQRFSSWENLDEWHRFVEEATAEFHRVLKIGGLLRWKLMDGARSHGRIIDYEHVFNGTLNGFEILADVRVFSRGPLARTNTKRWGSHSYVHYITLRKE